MSNQPIKHAIEPLKRLKQVTVRGMSLVVVCMVLLVESGLFPIALHAETPNAASSPPLPILVKTRQKDTTTNIARRYLNDDSKAWMIDEYNGIETLTGGEAIIVPMAPFRLGGLAPDGYQTVPVLAYSDIGDASGTRKQVSRSGFNQQMNWLETEGFTAITPVQLVDFMEFNGQLPRRSVLITFDTASLSFYDIGIPILKQHGFTATLFVATDDVNGKATMDWNQIKQLHEEGFTIACRGKSGRALTRRTRKEAFETYFKSAESELRLARKAIETHLDVPCLFLAYPQGKTTSLISAMVAKLGFSAAFVLQSGDNQFFTNRFGIHRNLIDSRIDPKQFENMLTTVIKADLN